MYVIQYVMGFKKIEEPGNTRNHNQRLYTNNLEDLDYTNKCFFILFDYIDTNKPTGI